MYELRRFLSVPPEPRSTGSIIWWWELRRIPYNLIVAGTGILAITLFYFFVEQSGELKPGEDAVEPLVLIGAIFGSAIGANICYTGGWAVELIIRSRGRQNSPMIGPVMFKLGLLFSMAVVSLPAIGWAGIYFVTLFRRLL